MKRKHQCRLYQKFENLDKRIYIYIYVRKTFKPTANCIEKNWAIKTYHSFSHKNLFEKISIACP